MNNSKISKKNLKSEEISSIYPGIPYIHNKPSHHTSLQLGHVGIAPPSSSDVLDLHIDKSTTRPQRTQLSINQLVMVP